MSRAPLSDAAIVWLAYFRDLGWDSVYLSQGGQGTAEEAGDAAETVVDVASADAWKVLRDEALACRRCPLAEGRTQVVFGSGHPNADLMFVGEGPGYHEDQQGLPFVGAAGELLTRIIEAIDLKREEVYIANIVKCRPPNNRDPTFDEVSACRPYLDQQIDLVKPRVLVALGRVAAQTLLEDTRSIGKMRGRWYQFRGVDLRATYHPAALLRNAGLKRPVWEDMQEVRDHLRALKRT